MPTAATATPGPISFEFVIGNRPDQLKAGTSKRLRSHLSKQGWKAHLEQQTQLASASSESPASNAGQGTANEKQQDDTSRRRSKRKRRQRVVTYELQLNSAAVRSDTIPVTNGEELGRALIRGSAGDASALLPMIPPIDYILGGGRVDPFKSYPGPCKAYTPHLVDHYIMHMAVDIPELDQPGHKGLLRTRWFRLATTETSTFQVVILLSAANFVTIKGGVASELGFQMLQLKHDAITSINSAMQEEGKYLSDSIIGAVAKMASFEAMHGDEASFRMHMEGLKRMVQMRGGLNHLGLGGLLRRMIIWIDLNGGFLLQTPRYFPGQTFAGSEEEVPEPNPARFIAI